MKRLILAAGLTAAVLSAHADKKMTFAHPATTWDESLPLGNGTVGALVWSKNDTLRLSLDRTDLWDLRPNDSIAAKDTYSFGWVKEHIKNGNYEAVQAKLDDPYSIYPTPTKLPGAALELPGLPTRNESTKAEVDMTTATGIVEYQDGTRLETFVHATKPVGWFKITGPAATQISPQIKSPKYANDNPEVINDNSHAGQGLFVLGYSQGKTTSEPGHINYRQPGKNGFEYDIDVRYALHGDTLTGAWSIGSTIGNSNADDETFAAMKRGMESDKQSHLNFWDRFYAKSSITVPDSTLQWQYDTEMYKLGSLARADSYPISLQGVWTADNGSLPPWKGDYHHDLNTQLSYWPVYAGNHLEEGMGYLNTLWNQRDTYKKFTKQYFGTDGMNVPGVCTLEGEPMGGWIQYSMSQSCGAWLAHHFYLHWKYSADRDFLRDRAYPFTKDVAIYLEQQLTKDPDGKMRLEYSSSPEYNDNSREAWFDKMTNYELSLIKWLFGAAEEMAAELGKKKEAKHWKNIAGKLPELSTDESGSLAIAPGTPLEASHRHMSHAMAIHPLGLLDVTRGDSAVINATLDRLEQLGPDWWVGYSYSWYGALHATALHGDKAYDALKTFAECFCLPNSFHVNGDQSRSGKSKFTYRPFTLEGNMAFAAALQRMLIQSHTGTIRLFPAIPSDWKDVSFDKLRTQGGFLISAEMKNGILASAKATSERGGKLRIKLPDGVKEVYIHAGKEVDLLKL